MTSLRISALVLLLSGATLLSPAQAVDSATKPYVPRFPVYRDLLENRPGALLTYQMSVLVNDLQLALTEFARHTGRAPHSIAEFLAVDLLPFAALDEAGTPRTWRALGEEEIPAPNEIGLRLRSDELRVVIMGADGDPLAPLFQSIRIQQNGWVVPNGAQLPAEYPLSARRLTVASQALLRRVYDFNQLTGGDPASWRDIEDRLSWRLMPGYHLGPGTPALTIRHAPSAVRTTIHFQPATFPPWEMTYGPGVRLEPALLNHPVPDTEFCTLVVPPDDGTWPGLHDPLPTPAELIEKEAHIGFPDLDTVVTELRFYQQRVSQGGLDPATDLNSMLSVRVRSDGVVLPVSRLPDFPAPQIKLDPQNAAPFFEAYEKPLDTGEVAFVWTLVGDQVRCAIPFPESVASRWTLPQRESLSRIYSVGQQLEQVNRHRSAPLRVFSLPATPIQQWQDAYTESWLEHTATINAIRLAAFERACLQRATNYSTRRAARPESWEAMDAVLGLVPHRYRSIPSLNSLAPGEMGIALAADPTARVWRITAQAPTGTRRQSYVFSAESRNIVANLGRAPLTLLDRPDLAALEFLPIGAVLLESDPEVSP